MIKRAKSQKEFTNYKLELLKRKKDSRAYSKHQVFGLLISETLDDYAHRALYIKLAKEGNAEELLIIAKNISEMRDIKNKGAYFMRIIHNNLISQKSNLKTIS